MKLPKLGNFNQSEIMMRMLVFFNSIFSSTLIAFAIFFFMDNGINAHEVSFLVSVKFWAIMLFSLSIYIFNQTQIRYLFVLSGILKIIAVIIIYLEQSLISLTAFILINCLGGILFSIPYKLYVQQTAKNISYEFSIRYTIHNIASALSPLLFYLFLDINSYLLFMLVISILFTLFSLKVNAKIAIRKERFFISFKSFDKDFFVFVFLSYILFSMCYLLYEQLIPTILKQWGNFNLYPIWVILNSIAIALLQIRLYKSVTKRITHQFSLILSFIICIILSGLFMFISQNIVTLFIVLVGVTYLEMFFSTAMDTLIASSKYSKDYFIFANFFLAIGATLSALSYSIGIEILGYVLLFLLCMLCIIYRKIFI